MCYYDVDVCNFIRFGILLSGSPCIAMNKQPHAYCTSQPACQVSDGWYHSPRSHCRVSLITMLSRPRASHTAQGFRCVWVCLDHQKRYAFCIDFHVRWIFLTTSLRIPPESFATRVGFGDKWDWFLTWKTIQNAFSRMLYTSMKAIHAKYTAQS